MAQPEAILQASILQFVRAVAPQLVIRHVPNGGYALNARAAARLKWQGVDAGTPDLLVWGLPEGRTGWIEVKPKGGVLSKAQLATGECLTQMGIPYTVARSVEDVRAFLEIHGVPTREAIGA